MNLGRLRQEIDRIDVRLLALLNRRASVAQRIGRLKREKGLPIFDSKRENTVLRRIIRSNGGPMSASSIRSIFREVLRIHRRLQSKG